MLEWVCRGIMYFLYRNQRPGVMLSNATFLLIGKDCQDNQIIRSKLRPCGSVSGLNTGFQDTLLAFIHYTNQTKRGETARMDIYEIHEEKRN